MAAPPERAVFRMVWEIIVAWKFFVGVFRVGETIILICRRMIKLTSWGYLKDYMFVLFKS
jgi:hypothetical protein